MGLHPPHRRGDSPHARLPRPVLLDELFAAVPEAVELAARPRAGRRGRRARRPGPHGGLADRNRARTDRLVCFAGGGAYDHEIPAGHPGAGRALRVRHLLHALPARGGPGRPPGRLRVPDHGRPHRRPPGGQRLALRRGQRRRRGRQPGRRGHGAPDRLGLRRDPPPLAARCSATFAVGTGHRIVDRPRWSTA